MKNTITKISTLILTLACALSLLVGCDATVDEDSFRKALTESLSNVTMTVDFTIGEETQQRTLRVVDGHTYLEVEKDKWLDTTDENTFIKFLNAISEHYNAFTFSDGAYRADSLHLVDDNENSADVANVVIKFNMSAKAQSVSFDQVEGGEVCASNVITLSDYGTTKAPEVTEVGGSGNVTDGNDFGNMGGNEFGNVGDGSDVVIGGQESFDKNEGENSSSGPIASDIDEKKWNEAFNLADKNCSVVVGADSPEGRYKLTYLIVGAKAYCSEDMMEWHEDTAEEFVASHLSSVAESFSEFYFTGTNFYCAFADKGNYALENVTVTFDEQYRLKAVSLTLVVNGERGVMNMEFYDYDVTVAP